MITDNITDNFIAYSYVLQIQNYKPLESPDALLI